MRNTLASGPRLAKPTSPDEGPSSPAVRTQLVGPFLGRAARSRPGPEPARPGASSSRPMRSPSRRSASRCPRSALSSTPPSSAQGTRSSAFTWPRPSSAAPTASSSTSLAPPPPSETPSAALAGTWRSSMTDGRLLLRGRRHWHLHLWRPRRAPLLWPPRQRVRPRSVRPRGPPARRQPWNPLAVAFAHPAPPDFRPSRPTSASPPSSAAGLNVLTLAASTLDLPVVSANPVLLSVLERAAGTPPTRDRRRTPDFVQRVHEAIRGSLRDGAPKMETLAKQLHVSARTLQRRLAEHQTTFQDAVDAVRCELGPASTSRIRTWASARWPSSWVTPS